MGCSLVAVWADMVELLSDPAQCPVCFFVLTSAESRELSHKYVTVNEW